MSKVNEKRGMPSVVCFSISSCLESEVNETPADEKLSTYMLKYIWKYSMYNVLTLQII